MAEATPAGRKFPSMKAKKLLAVSMREPLAYTAIRHEGSHKILRAEGFPRLVWGHHDGATIPPGLVRTILVKQVGLTVDQALELIA
ncbi:MAG: type II toxin-antitoxin system HicA family toxin [Kineosporiaceae bacterium]